MSARTDHYSVCDVRTPVIAPLRVPAPLLRSSKMSTRKTPNLYSVTQLLKFRYQYHLPQQAGLKHELKMLSTILKILYKTNIFASFNPSIPF